MSHVRSAVVVMLFAVGLAQAAVPDEVAGLAWCTGTKDCLDWTDAAGAASYTVYRGVGSALWALPGAQQDSCTLGVFSSSSTEATTIEDPASGALHWFLVTASNADGEGTAGSGSATPRSVNSGGPCGAAAAALVLNEVDYDNIGTDAAEFVEIHNGAAAPASLTGIALILVNGQGAVEYDRIDLAAAGPTLAAGAYLVVGAPSVIAALPPGTPSLAFSVATNALQNGAPDGVALFDTTSQTLIDALSYEGSITAAQFDGVAGTFDLVEGTPTTAADSNAVQGTLARFPNGSDTDDASVDWWFNDVPSPGLANPIP